MCMWLCLSVGHALAAVAGKLRRQQTLSGPGQPVTGPEGPLKGWLVPPVPAYLWFLLGGLQQGIRIWLGLFGQRPLRYLTATSARFPCGSRTCPLLHARIARRDMEIHEKPLLTCSLPRKQNKEGSYAKGPDTIEPHIGGCSSVAANCKRVVFCMKCMLEISA